VTVVRIPDGAFYCVHNDERSESSERSRICISIRTLPVAHSERTWASTSGIGSNPWRSTSPDANREQQRAVSRTEAHTEGIRIRERNERSEWSDRSSSLWRSVRLRSQLWCGVTRWGLLEPPRSQVVRETSSLSSSRKSKIAHLD